MTSKVRKVVEGEKRLSIDNKVGRRDADRIVSLGIYRRRHKRQT